MPITEAKDIRINQDDELEAIIGHPPGWTLQWGITVVFAFMFLLLGISWMVRYADVVEAPVVFTTEHPPIRLIAGASAKIARLDVKNGQTVTENDLLGVLDNPAEVKDILTLNQFILDLETNDPAAILSIELPQELKLGALQGAYATFSQDYQELKYFLKQDINYQKINNLRNQIVEIQRLERSLKKQILLFEDELVLSQKNVTRDSTLYMQNSLSELEYEQSKTAHLIKRRNLEKIKSGAASNQLEIKQLEAIILDLKQRQSDDQNEYVVNLRTDIQRLKGEVDKWKQTWLLIAPISGEIALTNAWSEQQFIDAGEEVLTIVPQKNAGDVIAKAQLKGMASGKVNPGMEAHIRMTGYPYQEYGVVNGQVHRIAAVPGKNGYELDILLDNGLITSYQKEITFRQEMIGTARIVTEERRLLFRILDKIKAAIEE